MKFDFEKIKRKLSGKAKEYASDKKKTKGLLDDAIKKAKNDGPLAEIWEYLQPMFGMIKDWISGDYTKIPVNSIIFIIIGLLYFVTPFDIIPNFVPGVGIIDDAAVLGFIIKEE